MTYNTYKIFLIVSFCKFYFRKKCKFIKAGLELKVWARRYGQAISVNYNYSLIKYSNFHW